MAEKRIHIHVFALTLLLIFGVTAISILNDPASMTGYVAYDYDSLSDACKKLFGDPFCDDSKEDCGTHFIPRIISDWWGTYSLVECDECQTYNKGGEPGFDKCVVDVDCTSDGDSNTNCYPSSCDSYTSCYNTANCDCAALGAHYACWGSCKKGEGKEVIPFCTSDDDSNTNCYPSSCDSYTSCYSTADCDCAIPGRYACEGSCEKEATPKSCTSYDAGGCNDINKYCDKTTNKCASCTSGFFNCNDKKGCECGAGYSQKGYVCSSDYCKEKAEEEVPTVEEPEPVEEPKCTDSDGGKNYNVKGVCKDASGTKPTDYCSSYSKLQEYYCMYNQVTEQTYCKKESIECLNGCKNGICQHEEEIIETNTCQNSCGGKSKTGDCWCDTGCVDVENDDCCLDYWDVCLGEEEPIIKPSTCEKYFGDKVCDDSEEDCGDYYQLGGSFFRPAKSLDECDECQTYKDGKSGFDCVKKGNIVSGCTLQNGLTCMDFRVTPSIVELIIRNNLKESIILSSIEIPSGKCSLTVNKKLDKSSSYTAKITDCSNGYAGLNFKSKINIIYTTLEYENIGSLSTKVVASSAEKDISGDYCIPNKKTPDGCYCDESSVTKHGDFCDDIYEVCGIDPGGKKSSKSGSCKA